MLMSFGEIRNRTERAVNVLEAHGQVMTACNRAHAVTAPAAFEDVFGKSTYSELSVAGNDAHAVVKEITNALRNGSAVALEGEGGKLWPVYLGANNAMKAQEGGASTIEGTSGWRRKQTLDAAALATPALRAARFLILSPPEPQKPLEASSRAKAQQGQAGPTYRPIEPTKQSGYRVHVPSEDEVLKHLREDRLDKFRIRSLIGENPDFGEAFHTQASKIIVTRDPLLVGEAIQAGLKMPEAQRIAFVKSLAERSPDFVTSNMRDFHIANPEDRVAIAKQVIAATGSEYMELIYHRFDITNDKVGAELDAMAAAFDAASKTPVVRRRAW
jgi:hypothetical protein